MDVVRRMECDLAGESIGQDSHPKRDGSGNNRPVRGDLDVDILIVLALFNPAETNKVDGQMLNVSLVEELINLRTNSSPQIVLAKSVVLVDWPKLHETRISLWPRGRCENILGRPKDQLETPASGASNSNGELQARGLPLLLGDIVARTRRKKR